jgi:hypothetical protein
MTEIWRDIKGYEGLYKISSFGNVKTVKRKVNTWFGGRTAPEKIIRLLEIANQRTTVTLYKGENYYRYTVDYLIMKSFCVTDENKSYAIEHVDGNLHNNSLKNLKVVCTNIENEIWKDIPSCGGMYEASNLGRIRSKKFKDGVVKYKVLKNQHGAQDYAQVQVTYNNRHLTKKVGILVCEAFYGKRPEGCHVCHNNSNPFDNRLENLRYDTSSANMLDKRLNGTDNRGEKHNLAKLTEIQVMEIRKLCETGEHTLAEVAKQYLITKSTVLNIVTNKIWSHLPHCKYQPKLSARLSNGEFIELMKIIDSGLFTLSKIAKVYKIPYGSMYKIAHRKVRGLQYA